jgi:hypothetical protein
MIAIYSGSPAEATREALVQRIIELARNGERDLVRLRDQAVGLRAASEAGRSYDG